MQPGIVSLPLSPMAPLPMAEMISYGLSLHEVGFANDALRSKLRQGEIDSEAVGGENAVLYANDTVPGVHLAG